MKRKMSEYDELQKEYQKLKQNKNVQFFKKNAPKLKTNSNRLLYREDIIYSYLTLQIIRILYLNQISLFDIYH